MEDKILTAKDALEIVKPYLDGDIALMMPDELEGALMMSFAALTKEVPIKPLERKRIGKKAIEMIYRCPCPGCDEAHGHVFTSAEAARKVRRCPECGQRLEWDDDDDRTA